MARLPDPTGQLTGSDRDLFERMASVRAHAEGRPELGEVYVRMFNNPGVARVVGALGEHLRFHGVLPDRIRELVILRFAERERFAYEWAHHVRPAALAGIDDAVVHDLGTGSVPAGLDAVERAVVVAVDAIAAKRSIPQAIQDLIVDSYGTAGVVEITALCGLYSIMGFMVTTFDIPIEPGFPEPPWEHPS